MSIHAQQAENDFIAHADSVVKVLYSDIEDDIKIVENERFEEIVYSFLSAPVSEKISFDSIKFVKYLKPADGNFSILTWVVPLSDHKFLYSGFIQNYFSDNSDTVIQLKPDASEFHLNTTHPSDHWPGAVYYNIISNQSNNTNYYTLFGWVGQSQNLAGKVIEVISFDTTGMPLFGKPVFSMKTGEAQHRVLFRYTDQIPFHLGYERQLLPTNKKREEWMIVFNRLTGNNPAMGRMFYGAVPSYDIFDAFINIGGEWVLFEDIDPRVETKTPVDDRSK